MDGRQHANETSISSPGLHQTYNICFIEPTDTKIKIYDTFFFFKVH